ncbi:MAG: ATP-binding protein [Saprospirales bacterium]|nr:ATP-binding protein [Saprospirales bacterium]
MKTIHRLLQEKLQSKLLPGKVVLMLGPRRVGKTFLLHRILANVTEPYLYWSGEDTELWKLLETRSVAHYRNLIGGHKLLVIDEAQKIKEVGAVLKLMIDHIEGLKILTTGSSAFDLNRRLGEPLTGRKWTFHLFPLSEQEFSVEEDYLTQQSQIRERLVLGSYPELLHLPDRGDKTAYLSGLVKDYLLKDILELEGLRHTHKLIDLLRLLAFQVGSEVSVPEMGRQLGMDKNTVDRYLNLLAEIFIIFNVRGYSRNLRKEIVKNSKWYFFDNGIRNALISNFNPIEIRNDQGALWENHMLSERLKYQHYNGISSNNFFWRTYDQQELDWVDEREGQLFGYEMKWGKTTAKAPVGWVRAYPESTFKVIHPGNFREFVGEVF